MEIYSIVANQIGLETEEHLLEDWYNTHTETNALNSDLAPRLAQINTHKV